MKPRVRTQSADRPLHCAVCGELRAYIVVVLREEYPLCDADVDRFTDVLETALAARVKG